MVKYKKQKEYIEKRKERGERRVDFYAQEAFISTLDEFSERVGRPRTYVIKAIITDYLKKRGYKLKELWAIMDKPKKDIF